MVQMNQYKRLADTLLCSIDRLRSGDDAAGLSALQSGLEAMEEVIKASVSMNETKTATELEDPLNKVREAVGNQDITGLADVLASVVYPLVKDLSEESEKI